MDKVVDPIKQCGVIGMILIGAHLVFSIVAASCEFLINDSASTGLGLFLWIFLQMISVEFVSSLNGTADAWNKASFWVLSGAYLLFLIIVHAWAGLGGSHVAEHSKRYAAAIAFWTLDFFVVAIMMVWMFLKGRTSYAPVEQV